MNKMNKSSYKGVNDPVHGWIKIPSYLPVFIDSPLFQRLDYVHQLTLSNKVFPGANHSRKDHSLGVMHVAQKYTDKLFKDENVKKAMVVAACWHDLGHGPFSHSWDRSVFKYIYPNVDKGHDEHRKFMLQTRYESTLNEIGLTSKDILECWETNKLYKSILQGPCGCDRMDFTLRDTFYTGVQHFGYYDIDRIIENTSVIDTPDGKRLCYHEKVYPDLIQGLNTRINMYEHIYYHKTSVALQILLKEAIEETKDQLKFIERTRNIDYFQYLTDAILFEMIPLSESARCVYMRKFPKLAEEKIVQSNELHGISSPKPSLTESIDDDYYEWSSPILSNAHNKEFEKHDIYILTKNQGPLKFTDYWRNQKESFNVTSWQIVRKYK